MALLQSLITATRLATWLRIDTETLRLWRVNGFLPSAKTIGGVAHYNVQNVNDLLERGARNFAQTPTVAALQAGTLTLLRPEEACVRLGISKDVLYTRVRTQRLSAIKLLDSLRLDAASVEAYLAAARSADLIPRTRAAHALGVTMAPLKQWVRSNDLDCVAVPDNLHLRPVTRESLLRLLTKLLPDWIDPNDWLEDRLDDNRPLMSLKDLLPYLGFDTKGEQAHALMDAQRLMYLRLPGGDLKFSPLSVDAVLDREPPLTSLQLGTLFGVPGSAVRRWRSSGRLSCRLHMHEEHELYRPCVLEILRTCLDTGIPARSWYDWRMRRTDPLLTSEELANALGVPVDHIPQLVNAGILRGIREPGTETRRFAANQVKRARPRTRGLAQ
ncbi:MAG TPA: helix-turn-helix domain-containing protein [Candidatus Saccharimonadales bacterium]|nr:helix-turn-helix domain-containing protein [Candidatus Saccharimonadales bacterium]